MELNKDSVKAAGQKVGGFFNEHWKVILHGFLVLVVFADGWVACIHFGKNVVEVPVYQTIEKRVDIPVTIPVETAGETQIQYVEKTSPSDSDVEINASKPTIQMKYNDSTYKLDTVANETHKFDKGKLKVDTSTNTTIDVTPIVDREVKIAVSENQKVADKDKEAAVQKAKENSHKAIRKDTAEGFGAGVLVGILLGVL